MNSPAWMRRIQPALWHLDAARGPSTPSFDHLVGKAEQPQRHDEFQALGSLHADDESVFGRACTGRSPGFEPLRIRSM